MKIQNSSYFLVATFIMCLSTHAGELTVTTTPASEDVSGKKYVFIDKDKNVNFSASASDYSGSIDSWKWVFPNGQPDSSDKQNPGNVLFGSAALGQVNKCTVGLKHVDNGVTCTAESKVISTIHVYIPRFTVTINAFISANYLNSIFNSNRIYAGDNRSWDKNGSSRCHQTFDIIPVTSVSSSGVENNSSKCDESQLYEKSSSLNTSGEISSLARGDMTAGPPLKVDWKTATPTCTATKDSAPKKNSIKVKVSGSATNPVSIEPITPSIDYHIDITIDVSDPEHPTYTLSGTTDEFPSYEIYIGSKKVYSYSESGHSPTGLFFEDNNVTGSGDL
jgi:hypothetical protein